MNGPTCPGCGTNAPKRGALMCDGCWAEVPTKTRRELVGAWKAYAARPLSAQLRRDYEQAIGAAVGSIR